MPEAILENEQITAHLSPHEIEALFDYERQLGLCPQFVDRVVQLTEADRARDEAEGGGAP
ncbi:MAG: hypothetical protein DPW09_43410 [Anaerolineae bacterium]|nr:hypothetical protein [Anaerolineae bacterium]